MSVSTVDQVTTEHFALGTSSFVRAGVLYVIWSSGSGAALSRKISWKPHTGANFSEVDGKLIASFKNLSCLMMSGDELLVFWDDDGGPGSADADVFMARFNPTTGALISGPTVVTAGAKPVVSFLNGVAGNSLVLSYLLRSRGVPYIRQSFDGGAAWTGAKPILTNRVRNTEDVVAVPFDAGHVSLAQVGSPARPILEIGGFNRTRPVTNMAKHPTLANRIYLGEAANYNDGTALRRNDNLRGGLAVARDGSKLYWLDGTSQGTSDSVGSVALLNVSNPTTPTVVASMSPGDSFPGDNIVELNLVPSSAVIVDLFGTGSRPICNDLALSDQYVYVTGNRDTNAGVAAIAGGADVFRISDRTRALYIPDVAGDPCWAVAVGIYPSSTPVIFTAMQESGTHKLKIHTENGLTPTLQASHNLPARVNAIRVEMQSATTGFLTVSMVDRLNFYYLNGLTSPIRLMGSLPIMTNGQFFKTARASNNNVVCAVGRAGIAVLNPSGTVLAAHGTLSGFQVQPWEPSKVYALNSLVRARSTHPFAPQGLYFRCTTAGTSGTWEPSWSSNTTSNSIVDGGTTRWAAVEPLHAVVTDVLIDDSTKRIYASGVVGGDLGTAGRLWVIDGKGLI
jgi:hypothetical protein